MYKRSLTWGGRTPKSMHIGLSSLPIQPTASVDLHRNYNIPLSPTLSNVEWAYCAGFLSGSTACLYINHWNSHCCSPSGVLTPAEVNHQEVAAACAAPLGLCCTVQAGHHTVLRFLWWWHMRSSLNHLPWHVRCGAPHDCNTQSVCWRSYAHGWGHWSRYMSL